MEERLTVDLGCGVHKRGTVGIDINPKSHADILGDIHQTPFRDEAFTRGYCYLTLEHLQNPLTVLREMRRIIREDGILSIPNIINLRGFLRWMIRGKLTGSDDHLNAWTIRELKNLINRAGLRFGGYSTTTTEYYNKPSRARRLIPRIFDKDLVVRVEK